MQVNAFNTQLRSLSVSKAGGRHIIATAPCSITTPSQVTFTVGAQKRQVQVELEQPEGKYERCLRASFTPRRGRVVCYCIIYYQANQPVAPDSDMAVAPITYQYNVTMGRLRAI